jgi:hypothetical protein
MLVSPEGEFCNRKGSVPCEILRRWQKSNPVAALLGLLRPTAPGGRAHPGATGPVRCESDDNRSVRSALEWLESAASNEKLKRTQALDLVE